MLVGKLALFGGSRLSHVGLTTAAAAAAGLCVGKSEHVGQSISNIGETQQHQWDTQHGVGDTHQSPPECLGRYVAVTLTLKLALTLILILTLTLKLYTLCCRNLNTVTLTLTLPSTQYTLYTPTGPRMSWTLCCLNLDIDTLTRRLHTPVAPEYLVVTLTLTLKLTLILTFDI